MENLPPEIFFYKILPYLSAKDVFNLGLTCSTLKNKVKLYGKLHPIGVSLQALITSKNWIYNRQTSYKEKSGDVIFSGAYKCCNERCDCQNYMMRGTLIILKPKSCESCLYWGCSWINCNIHHKLMWDFLCIGSKCIEIFNDFCTQSESQLGCNYS